MTAIAIDPAKTALPDASLDTTKPFGVLAEFETPGDILRAAERVRDAGFAKWDCYTPFPVHGLDAAMGIRRTFLPTLVFICGVAGLAAGTFLQFWTMAIFVPGLPAWIQGYEFIISAKPLFSTPAFIPVMFELTILFSGFGTFFGLLAMNGLPRLSNPIFSSGRFRRATQDRFFLSVHADDENYNADRVTALLNEAGARHVEVVYQLKDSRLPSWLPTVLVTLVLLALIPPGWALLSRATTSPEIKRRIHQSMGNQPKLKEQQAFALFADGRAMRPLVPGTVARGMLVLDDGYFHGLQGTKPLAAAPENFREAGLVNVGDRVGTWLEQIPVPVTPAFIERGQLKYNVNCAVCHGLSGLGNGTVWEQARRKQLEWAEPKNLHLPEYRPGGALGSDGYLFNVISRGKGNMAGYAHQIDVLDRWAIVAYVRALQEADSPAQQTVRQTDPSDAPTTQPAALHTALAVTGVLTK